MLARRVLPIKLFGSAFGFAAALCFFSSRIALAENARAPRPRNEPWSEGATLHLKEQNRLGKQSATRSLLRRNELRLKAIDWGHKATITINEDMRNYLAGAEGSQGEID